MEFKKQIVVLCLEKNNHLLIQTWYDRLHFNESQLSLGETKEIAVVAFIFFALTWILYLQ